MAEREQLNPEAIVHWLRDHPDFFIHHPELLTQLEFPHDTTAESLLERQVGKLRAENQKLGRQLRELVGIAGQNEKLMQRLHVLTLELTATVSPEELIHRLGERLGEDFRSDTVVLLLDDPGPALAGIGAVQALPSQRPEWLTRLLQSSAPLCGRLTREKATLVFGQTTDSVDSAALVPLGEDGLLAIGSHDAERFFPGMGTLFLELLGSTVKDRLSRLANGQRKSA